MTLRGLRGVSQRATVVLRVQESTEIIPKLIDNQNDYEAYFWWFCRHDLYATARRQAARRFIQVLWDKLVDRKW